MSTDFGAAGHSDDLLLVKRAQGGDQRAFRTLVERYQRRVFGIAFGLLKDREAALDVAQEAFVRVHKYLPQFKGSSSFYTWLYRITVNVSVDLLRKRRPEELELDEEVSADDEGSAGELAAHVGTNPQRAALRRELAEKIGEALEALPPKHRAILLLREVDGMSYEDLARTLEIPKGTVMSRLFHARLKVQKVLNEYLELDEAKSGVGTE